jgi:hypothetical protein
MKPVLRRVALQGGLTALLLGVVGYMLVELASIWLASAPGQRVATGGAVEAPDADGAVAAVLRQRVPLVMAVWGFGLVAVGELGLYLWRRRRLPSTPQGSAVGDQRSEDAEQKADCESKPTENAQSTAHG